jgi:hypothetical protein
MSIPSITLYSLSGDIITSGQVSPYLWKQIKDFNNISKKNPHKIIFIPCNTNIKLEFIDDMICSPYGTDFTVLYNEISLQDYKIMYCKYSRNNSCDHNEFYEEFDFIPESCDCKYCLHETKKMNATDYRDKRIKQFQDTVNIN